MGYDAETTVADISRDDIIDTRDLEEIREELRDIADARTAWVDDPDRDADDEPDALTDEQAELLRLLDSLADDIMDWKYGETLIRDSYFEQYAQEFAEDIGAIDKNASWPNTHIDWEAAADSLKMDYSAFDIGGVTYWARA